MADSVRTFFEGLPGKFNSEAWGDQDAVLVFEITGANGGQWAATIKGGALSLQEGTVSSPDMTMTCSDEDLLAMVNGELNPVSAFMSGKIKIGGDMSLAMKLQGLLGV